MSAERIPSQNDAAEPRIPEQLDFDFKEKETWIRARAEELRGEHGWMKSYATDVAWQEWNTKELKERSGQKGKSD